MKPVLAGLLLCSMAAAQPPRPRVLGIAHFAIRVSDLDKARAYYKNFLGCSCPSRGFRNTSLTWE